MHYIRILVVLLTCHLCTPSPWCCEHFWYVTCEAPCQGLEEARQVIQHSPGVRQELNCTKPSKALLDPKRLVNFEQYTTLYTQEFAPSHIWNEYCISIMSARVLQYISFIYILIDLCQVSLLAPVLVFFADWQWWFVSANSCKRHCHCVVELGWHDMHAINSWINWTWIQTLNSTESCPATIKGSNDPNSVLLLLTACMQGVVYGLHSFCCVSFPK